MSINSFPKFILIHYNSINVNNCAWHVSRVHEVARNRHCYYCRTSELSCFLCLDFYLQHIPQFPLQCEGSYFTQDIQECNQKTTVEADFITSKQVSQQEHANSGHRGRNVVGIKKEWFFGIVLNIGIENRSLIELSCIIF